MNARNFIVLIAGVAAICGGLAATAPPAKIAPNALVAPIAPTVIAPTAPVAPTPIAPMAPIAPIAPTPIAPMASPAPIAPVNLAPIAPIAPVAPAPVAPIGSTPVFPVVPIPVESGNFFISNGVITVKSFANGLPEQSTNALSQRTRQPAVGVTNNPTGVILPVGQPLVNTSAPPVEH